MTNSQAWNRLAYVYNNPVNFTDPSGHWPLCRVYDDIPCTKPSDYNVSPTQYQNPNINIETSIPNPTTVSQNNNQVPEIVVFGGSYGQQQIEEAGPPDIDDATTAWTVDLNGNDVKYWVPYPGSKSGQSSDALGMGLPNDQALALICYSASTETCLMFTKAFLESGGNVHSIILLGPTFVAGNEDGVRQEADYWMDEMDNLLEKGVNIGLVDDDAAAAEAQLYVPPISTGAGAYKYWNRRNYPHHQGGYPGFGTNNDPNLRNEVYAWISSLIQ